MALVLTRPGRAGRVRSSTRGHGSLPLVVVGLAAAAAFTVRREGLAMIGAVGIAQLAALAAAGSRAVAPFDRRQLGRCWRGSRVPHATFLAAVGLLQITLPSTVVPKYDGTSVTNVWTLRGRLVRNLAQVSGLQRPWDKDPIVLGSIDVRLVAARHLPRARGRRHRARDLAVPHPRPAPRRLRRRPRSSSAAASAHRSTATSPPSAPVLMLLALVAVRTRSLRTVRQHPRVATIVVTVALVAIVAGNVANAKLRVEGADRAA